MAEDTVNKAIQRAGLPERKCVTETLPIYDGEDEGIRALVASNPDWGVPLHPRLPYIRAQVVWAAREELCMTVEDSLSRRTRSLLLDARAAMECAPLAASLLAAELGRDETWQTQQIHLFRELAGNYLPDLPTP
jgi:glycerol-3-phosphate dehydrogenase